MTEFSKIVELPMDTLVANYVKVRAKKKALAQKHDEQMKPYDHAMEQLSSAMLQKLTEDKSLSQKTANGTVYISRKKAANLIDFDTFWTWVREKNLPDLLHRRVSSTVAADYNRDHPDEPVPGVQIETIQTINVRAK